MPVAENSVTNGRCAGPQMPATWLIAPDAWVSSTCAASTGWSMVPFRTCTALTRTTSPAIHRAMSRSWIIWSMMMPPDSSGSANQAERVGKPPERTKRSTASSPSCPASTAALRRTYSGKYRTTCAG